MSKKPQPAGLRAQTPRVLVIAAMEDTIRYLCTSLTMTMVLLSGCGTVAVERAKNVSSAGVAYAQATAGVIDVAIDASIDASSERQVRAKPRPPVSEKDQEVRAANLKKLDDELVKNAVNYTRLKRSVTAVEAYFRALQQLADGSPAEGTETAVKSLADRLNGLNEALDRTDSGKPLIDEKQKGAIAGLSKVVAKQVHGALLAEALERDAPTIGRTLVLQELVLKAAADDIRANLAEAATRFYTDRVVGPYKAGDIGAAWVNDRRTYLKVRALGNTAEAVSSAEAAARQMQTVWERILSGEYSAKELTTMLKDTEELLAAVAALKAANEKK